MSQQPEMVLSFEAPATLEQKIYVSKCNFYWPFLLPLWNPQSKNHWTKMLLSLNLADIPPHALLAAAQHGYYILKGGPKQQIYTDIIMAKFTYPLPQSCWSDLIENQDTEFLKQTLQPEAAGWRPLGYLEKRQQLFHDPMCRRKKNATFRNRGLHATKQMKEEEMECLAALQQLEIWVEEKNKELEKTSTPKENRRNANTKYHVNLQKVSNRRGAEVPPHIEDCGICRSKLVDEPVLDRTIRRHAASLAFLKDPAKKYRKYYRRESQTSSRREWQKTKEELMDGQLRGLPETEVERLATDLLDFRRSIPQAKRHLQQIIEEDEQDERCFYPVKLDCGHVMGLTCIITWIQQNPSCPFCRKKLNHPPPQAHKLQQNQMLIAQGFEEEVAEGLAGLAGLGGIFLGVNGEGEVANDLVFGNGDGSAGELMMGLDLGEMEDALLEEADMDMDNDGADANPPALVPPRRTTGRISLPGYRAAPEEEHEDMHGDLMEDDF